MGRSITASASALSLSPTPSALTQGSQMSAGSLPRASYALLSNNSSSGAYNAVFLDSEFRQIAYSGHNTLNGHSGSIDYYDSSYTGINQKVSTAGPTQTAPSTSSTTSWVQATNSCGEFGNDGTFASERGLTGNNIQRTGTGGSLSTANFSFVNSDHADRSRVLMLFNGILASMNRFRPLPPAAGGVSTRLSKVKSVAAAFGTASITSMYGSASYNATRKELVIMAYNSAVSGQYDVQIFKNFELNGLSLDVSQLPAIPASTFSVNAATIGAFSGATTESQFRITPVLTDDGTIYFAGMFPTVALRLFKIVRSAGDTVGTLTLADSLTLTNPTYGLEQGSHYGMKTMQSRDGGMVLTFCAYYYYGSGLMSFVVDKRRNSFARGMVSTDTGVGVQPVPYGDAGFASYYAGNYYASNSQAGYINAMTLPGSTATAAPVTTTTAVFLPIAPGPNTTNYPGMTQVWEYAMQTELPY